MKKLASIVSLIGLINTIWYLTTYKLPGYSLALNVVVLLLGIFPVALTLFIKRLSQFKENLALALFVTIGALQLILLAGYSGF